MFLNQRSSSRTPSASFSEFLSLSFSIGSQDNSGNISTYEDRTSRFFPSAPRVPQMPGVVPGDIGFMDKSEDSFRELSNSSHQRFNILCSGTKMGASALEYLAYFPLEKLYHYICFIIDVTEGCEVYNLGTGKGTSVLEMVTAFENASGKIIPLTFVGRRPGHAEVVYASADKAEHQLIWKLVFNDVWKYTCK